MRVLVTGGGGFLGTAIVQRLVARGDEVVSVTRSAYPHLEVLGVTCARGDIAEAGVVERAAEGCDAIIHVAARAGVWGAHESFHRVNVVGTQRVIDACVVAGIPTLVHTSTPSVVHAGGDVEGVDESAPLSEHFEAPYPETKAEAERRVLDANGRHLSSGGELAVCALRPHLIWGPEDTQFFPRVVDRARRGRLRLVGGGEQLVDAVYVDNAAEAHILALDLLHTEGTAAACSGKPYFITNDEPVPQHVVINGMLEAAGLPPCEASISPRVAYAAGAVLETLFRAFRVTREPPMTRFVAKQLATAHWYDIRAAKRDLGYAPEVSMDEGFGRLRAWARAQQGNA